MLVLNVGGLSVPNNDDNENFSSQALRRARLDLIFKDYEVTSIKNALVLIVVVCYMFLFRNVYGSR